MYVISLPWKLLFAIVPPTTFANGWATFWVALALIGGVTAFIGDLAALFGCILGIEDEITAITFVALGTSLPDTFASVAAAANDPTADNAVGNVTGSNCVNVFLGLGLPWLMAAVFWSNERMSPDWLARFGPGGTDKDMTIDYPAGGFVVMAGNLGTSVAVFTICACTCIGMLYYRRKSNGAELGGDKKAVCSSTVVLYDNSTRLQIVLIVASALRLPSSLTVCVCVLALHCPSTVCASSLHTKANIASVMMICLWGVYVAVSSYVIMASMEDTTGAPTSAPGSA
jgi:Ca2+/Na+ antiporter